MRATDTTTQSLSAIQTQIDEGEAVLVDVREQAEWDAGHIKDAIFLPLSTVRGGLTEADLKPLPKDKTLYVHCVVGKRAVAAANVLEQHGYTVQAIKPGYKELVAAGFPQATAP